MRMPQIARQRSTTRPISREGLRIPSSHDAAVCEAGWGGVEEGGKWAWEAQAKKRGQLGGEARRRREGVEDMRGRVCSNGQRQTASQFSYPTSASAFDAIHRLRRLLRRRHAACALGSRAVQGNARLLRLARPAFSELDAVD